MTSEKAAAPDSATRTQTIEGAIDAMPRAGLTRWASVALYVSFALGIYEAAILSLALNSLQSGLHVSTAQLTPAISLNLVGFAIGAWVIGFLADRLGRQFGLRLTFGVLGLGGLLTIFAWNVPTLTVARFIAGCGMGAVLALVSLYVSEVSPRTRRGNLIARISLVATLLVGISSVVSLPILKALPSEGWRPLLGVGAVALLLIPLVNRRDIVESPRWLVQHKRLAEAEVLVRKFEKKARAESTSETTTFVEPTAIIDAGTKTPFRSLINSKLQIGRASCRERV